jgi:hypothetical protein
MTRTVARLLAVALAAAALPTLAHANNLDGVYRGSFICEKLALAPDILRAPFDMIVNGKTAVFARPVFNRVGARVLGSELATGTVEDNGSIKLTSKWSLGPFGYEGNYSGIINGKLGTLTGTQAWHTPRGTEMRGCTVAFVRRGS